MAKTMRALLFSTTFLVCSCSVELPFISIQSLSRDEFESLTHRLSEQSWWTQIGDHLYSPSLDSSAADLERSDADEIDTTRSHYKYALGHLPEELESFRVGGSPSLHLLHSPDTSLNLERIAKKQAKKHGTCRGFNGILYDLEKESTLKGPWQPTDTKDPFQTSLTDAQVKALVDQVDRNKIEETMKKLTGFRTRNVFSAEVVEARDWIDSQFASLGLRVAKTTPGLERRQNGQFLENAHGLLQGTGGNEVVVVGAHYDDLPAGDQQAPGAEDNASGVAVMLEVARVLSKAWKVGGDQNTGLGLEKRTMPHHSVQFVGFGGEEVGLKGSENFVDSELKDHSKVRAAVIMDEVGWQSTKGKFGVQLETKNMDNTNRLKDLLGVEGNKLKELEITQSYNPYGSDHMPFINKGLPAVLLINHDDESYPNYHQGSDTLSEENINYDLMTKIARLEVAAVAKLVNPKVGTASAASFEKHKQVGHKKRRPQADLERGEDDGEFERDLDKSLHDLMESISK